MSSAELQAPGGSPQTLCAGRGTHWAGRRAGFLKVTCVTTRPCRLTAAVRAGVLDTSPGRGCSAFRAPQHERTIVKHGGGGLTNQLAFRGPLHRSHN